LLIALILLQSLVSARLGMTATDLTDANFNEVANQFDRLVVDFYDPSDSDWQQHQMELQSALVTVRKAGNSKVNFAKVDVSKWPTLASKFVKNGRYPQLVWFAHGQPTQYHRRMRSADMIIQFVMAMDRPPLTTVTSVASLADYSPVVLAEISKTSALYKSTEAVALRHMDSVAFLHMESGKNTISFYKDGALVQQYEGQHDDVDALDKWLKRQLPMKSEEIPSEEDAMDDGVRMVVGKNFEEMVLQKEKDVILLVQAPWCGYCKILAPKWKQLSHAVPSHVLVAQMDGERNQSPLPNDFVWDAYPTIFYVRAGETVPNVYRGDRTLESLLDFAKEHTSQPFGVAKQDGTDAIYDL